MNLIEKAKQFAHAAHDSIGQKRKYSGEPYWVHTDAVAQIVTDELYPIDYTGMYNDGEKVIAARNRADNIIAAAHLHDVLEDVTPKDKSGTYDYNNLIKEFGADVVALVVELTDEYTKEAFPKLNRTARHDLERARQAEISKDGKLIKLSDLINNTYDITKHDKDFARIYLKEKALLLPLLREGSEKLYQRALKQIEMLTLQLNLPKFDREVIFKEVDASNLRMDKL